MHYLPVNGIRACVLPITRFNLNLGDSPVAVGVCKLLLNFLLFYADRLSDKTLSLFMPSVQLLHLP
jgi:hypothetical protein